MRKAIRMATLTIIICCVLWGCGKSEAVKNVESLIDGIGEVTLESEESIKTAEEAYNSLNEKEKEKVENADQLVSKKEELDACITKAEEEKKQKEEEEKKEKLAPFLGTWVPLYQEVFKEYYDNSWSNDLWSVNLSITENNDNVTLENDNAITYVSSNAEMSTFELIEDQGIEKLVSPYGAGVYVRKDEYETARDKMFVHINLDQDNISDYIGGLIEIGKFIDEWGDETDTSAYTFSSAAYANENLIMLTYSDVKYEVYYKGSGDAVTYHELYPILQAWGSNTPSLDHFGRAEGEIWYVKKGYVSEINKENNKGADYKQITFTDGFCVDRYSPSISNINITVDDLEF